MPLSFSFLLTAFIKNTMSRDIDLSVNKRANIFFLCGNNHSNRANEINDVPNKRHLPFVNRHIKHQLNEKGKMIYILISECQLTY
jgi:hypothetical protein